MINCHQAAQMLEDRESILRFLRRETATEEVEAHFHRCPKCQSLFEAKLSTAMEKDLEIQEAFERAYELAQNSLAQQILKPILKQLRMAEWDLAESVEGVLARFRGELQDAPESNVLAEIFRSDLPAAAGGIGDLPNIPKEVLQTCGIPSDIAILCEHRAEGYEIRVQSSVPVKLTLVFFKGEQELLRTEISEQLPEKWISPEAITGWTNIRIVR